ncbi:sushi domain-containing protein 1 isoform X2 [Hyla sarda]|uniref:sushi domain-containing protein 1 isoform X2 n=1 Tax=Hyla sarda TaxID=327740 RepID=UPI0024C2A6AD|nr:sushi domain-containing protein 1 isoform X2 [Hyla sarda]
MYLYPMEEITPFSKDTNPSDVCKTCHPNATCIGKDNKYSCMCNFGLIGNGRTHCLDKNECQIGAHKICGDHTACHNTHGSYYCVCLKGYRPSNNHENFIPNDGTFCTDINECEDSNICGVNGKCKNIPGSYECYCKEGFSIENGTGPFQTLDGKFLCKDVDECEDPNICGVNGKCNNIPGSYECYCKEGFTLQNGTGPFQANGQSLCKDIDECKVLETCGDNGLCKNIPGSFECSCKEGYKLQNSIKTQSKHINFTCQAVDCGQPPVLPNTEIALSGATTFSSQVTYTCISGFLQHGHNISVCTANGTWEGATLVCTAIDCGTPVAMVNVVIHAYKSTTFGSIVTFTCAKGFIAVSGDNSSVCSNTGHWEGADLECKAIDCGPPVAMQNTVIHIFSSTTFGSIATFTCAKGFIAVSGNNFSVCSDTGHWEGADLHCNVADCGPPPSINHTKPGLPWNTTYGNTVNYECLPGFVMNSGNKTVTCTENGKWVGGGIICREIDCGPPPIVQNTEMKWNRETSLGSEVRYICQKGFYNAEIWHVSKCTSNETWENVTFPCTEVDCGMPYMIENAEWMWNNRTTLGSNVHYKCKPGFTDNGKKNFSVCLENTTWEEVNMTCSVKEDLIANLIIVNKTCLQWQKSLDIFGWEILYKFSIHGIRWNNKDFVDNKSLNYTTDNDNPIVCLDLLPDTNYTVSMVAITPALPAIQLNVMVKTTMQHSFGDIVVLNNSCLTWTRSSLAERSPEVYTVFIQGRILSSGSLLQSIMFNFSTDKVTPVLCLDLPFAAEYFVNITESSTELSAYTYINITRDETENSTKEQIFNETCLWWNHSFNGLQEIYKLYVQGERWSSQELFQDLLYKISTDHNISAICLDVPLDTQYPFNVTGTFSNLVGGEPIQNLTVFNETCLSWRRHFRSKELYVFFVYGYKRNEKRLSHELMFYVTSNEKQPVVCFDFQKGINYTVDVVSVFYPQYPVQISTFSPNPDTPLPKLKIVPAYRQLPKISFQRNDRSGSVSSYQVFVIKLVHRCSFTCESLEAVTYFSNISRTQGYVTAEFFPGDFSDHVEFFVGDRQYYGKFYNAPLERGKDYCVILRTLTKIRTQSCTVMAQVKELSGSYHHMTVVLLGSIAFACFIVFMSYSLARCCKS